MHMAKPPNFGFWILDFGLERKRREEAGHRGIRENGEYWSVLFSI
jgi:hypothetical protein